MGTHIMRNELFQSADRFRLLRHAGVLGLACTLLGAPVSAEGDVDADAINARLYQALAPPSGSGRIETVSGQMYLSKDNIDADVISEALATMRATPG